MTRLAENERLARFALSRLVEPGSWALVEAVGKHGAEQVWAWLRAGRPVGSLSAALVEAARARAAVHDVQLDVARLLACGGRLVCPGDDEWPEHRLSWRKVGPQLAAPPLSLQVRGRLPLHEAVERSVALVGARAATAYGEHVATEMALGLTDRGTSVVSGGAYGIDAAAHRGALTGGRAPTLAVLACGVDVAYPRGNDRLLARIGEVGVLVSEHPPGATPTRARFLVRNRLIAALSAGTVVVEAALRSGSLSTAGRAGELLRPVMAVPGPVTSAASAGCHALLRRTEEEGVVHLVTCAAEVLALVGRLGADDAPELRGPERPRDELPELVRQVLEALPVRGGAGEATIAREAGVPVADVQQVLPPLLIHGLVERCESGWRLTALGAGRPARRC